MLTLLKIYSWNVPCPLSDAFTNEINDYSLPRTHCRSLSPECVQGCWAIMEQKTVVHPEWLELTYCGINDRCKTAVWLSRLVQVQVHCMFVGDFAMLLNAGMSAKQALVYNCVSSVLCMLGMVFGVAVGNISSATSWIFALIAGLFLYVALVDMVRLLLTYNITLMAEIEKLDRGAMKKTWWYCKKR